VIAALLLASATSSSALACESIPSPDEIDTVLATTEARLSAEDIGKVRDLRQQTSEFLKFRRYLDAQHAYREAMRIMRMTYVTKGPPSRGCGGGEWVRKEEAPR
jgi:hypothetical protein